MPEEIILWELTCLLSGCNVDDFNGTTDFSFLLFNEPAGADRRLTVVEPLVITGDSMDRLMIATGAGRPNTGVDLLVTAIDLWVADVRRFGLDICLSVRAVDMLVTNEGLLRECAGLSITGAAFVEFTGVDLELADVALLMMDTAFPEPPVDVSVMVSAFLMMGVC